MSALNVLEIITGFLARLIGIRSYSTRKLLKVL
ncbi:hypothetical protein NIES4071_104050 (plasmid) [Calothrix sp. NIES-4071]|nr:hypothetical protein NIES4071_104050 [Calothrix sp. NIES-4071]BAZ64392.1 hypothetical protein NIES4105_101250 [Calothrix sp. NIES-4105]